MRHAKSSWDNPGLSDHDRPLNERGKTNAPQIGKELTKAGLIPDLVLCSDSRRTKETWDLVSKELGEKVKVKYEPDIYESDARTLLSLITNCSDDISTLMMIGHSPSCDALVHVLTGDYVTLKTANVVVLSCEEGTWKRTASVNWRIENHIKP